MKKIILILLLSLGAFFIAHANEDLISLFPIEHYDQTVSHWISPNATDYDKSLLSADVAKQHVDLFYKHFFGTSSPWDAEYINRILQQTAPDSVKSEELNVLENFNNENNSGNGIGYGENFRPYDKTWIDAIKYNINISEWNDFSYHANQRAIAIDNLHARVLPTDDPFFYSHTLAGEGFPFDNLQISALWAGTPVYVIAQTHDHVWSFVVTPDYIAWVKNSGLARVDNDFVNTWTAAAKNNLGAITQTKTSVVTIKGNFLFTAYVGSVFPVSKHQESLELLVPAVGNDHRAVIERAVMPIESAALMPLAATPHHFANVIETLIGRPYGWGNMYFYNDCSAELKSLLTPFGVWLPRHSSEQVKVGKMVDMTSYSPEQRLTYLKENGQRFLSIVYIGGHVVLYVGNDGDNAMTYQNVWGLKPNPPTRRAVIGKSVFLPMLLQYPEDILLTSLADKKYFRVSFLGELPANALMLKELPRIIDLRSLIFPDSSDIPA